MVDPIVLSAAVGLVVSPPAGRVWLRGLDLVPARSRRAAEWAPVVVVVAVAAAAGLLADGAIKESLFVLLLGALPGIAAYIAFRTWLASAVVSLVPLYFGVGAMTLGRPLHTPAIVVDRMLPVQPAWMLVYGSLYVFVLLPVFVVRDTDLFHRALRAYLTVLCLAYVGFILYPTAAPRPLHVPDDGFAAWCLRLQYALDQPYNCFPSLHVAHSFVSALTCSRVNRRVGIAATLWAVLIGVSTVFTKQHYVVDVLGGVAIALVADVAFLRGFPRAAITLADRNRAAVRAMRVVMIYAAVVVFFWALYLTGWTPR